LICVSIAFISAAFCLNPDINTETTITRLSTGEALISTLQDKGTPDRATRNEQKRYPGSPWQNDYSECFNSIYTTTCLNRCLFQSLTEARVVVAKWLEEYNSIRPRGSLNGLTPNEFAKQWQNKRWSVAARRLILLDTGLRRYPVDTNASKTHPISGSKTRATR
jgi:hypothetical protein